MKNRKWFRIALTVFVGSFFVLKLAASLLSFAGLHLRNVPYQILLWGGAASVLICIIYVCMRLCLKGGTGRQAALIAAAAVLSLLTLFFTFVFSILREAPEHVVEHNGRTCLARVVMWLDTNVDYYEYRGPLFCGNKLGTEFYGSGAVDPFVSGHSLTPKWEMWNEE